jgi:DNA-binding transcriptional regulator YdaS (Cro superfamily)
MKFEDIIEHFGSQSQLARQLGIDRANVSMWIANKAIPSAHAINIERLTEGKFRAVDIMLALEDSDQ